MMQTMNEKIVMNFMRRFQNSVVPYLTRGEATGMIAEAVSYANNMDKESLQTYVATVMNEYEDALAENSYPTALMH